MPIWNIRSARGWSIGHGRSWTSNSIGGRRVIDSDYFGCRAKDAIAWCTGKVLCALHATIVLAFADTISGQLETSIEAGLELDRTEMTKHTYEL